MKKILILLLALLCCISVFVSCDKEGEGEQTTVPEEETTVPNKVLDEKIKEGDWYFQLNEDHKSYRVVKYDGSETSIAIPATAAGAAVTEIGDAAFQKNTSLKSVEIGENVLKIGNLAFNGCSSLSTVKIAKSVWAIGYSAFAGTPWFSAQQGTNGFVIVGDGVLIKYLGTTSHAKMGDSLGIKYISDAFSGNHSITEVTVSKTTLYVGERAFYNCSQLKRLHLPVELKMFASSAIEKCPAVTEITFPGYEYGGGEY